MLMYNNSINFRIHFSWKIAIDRKSKHFTCFYFLSMDIFSRKKSNSIVMYPLHVPIYQTLVQPLVVPLPLSKLWYQVINCLLPPPPPPHLSNNFTSNSYISSLIHSKYTRSRVIYFTLLPPPPSLPPPHSKWNPCFSIFT